jgi:hypothetical protein
MGLSIYEEVYPLFVKKDIVAADGTASVVVVPVQNQPCRIDAFLMTNSDSITHSCLITMAVGAAVGLLGTQVVPIAAGLGAIPVFDAVTAGAPANLQGWILPAGAVLQVSVSPAMTGATGMYVSVLGGYL